MDDIFYEAENRRKWLESLRDGEPCDHVGCLNHVSHPCEGCGRIAGRRLTPRAADVCPECDGEELYSLRGDPVICWKCNGTGKRR